MYYSQERPECGNTQLPTCCQTRKPCAMRQARSKSPASRDKTFHIRKAPAENIHGPQYHVTSEAMTSLLITEKMASQSLLAVPAKSTKSVDFTQPFTRFIANNYDDQPSKYHDALSELNGLRESTVVRTPDKHETGLDLITRFACLCICCALS